MIHRFFRLNPFLKAIAGNRLFTVLAALSLGMAAMAQAQVTLLPASIPGGTVGFPYSTQLVASGGTGTGVVFTLVSGTLPSGVTLNSSTGLISGTPTAAGTFSPIIQVTDSGSNIDSKPYSLVVRASGILNTRWQGTQGTTQTYTGAAVIGTAGDTWNSFFTGTASNQPLVDNAGQSLPVSVSWNSVTAWHSLSRNGFCTPTPTGFCPLMNGYIAQNGGTVANVNFSGLPANTSWDMLLYNQIDSGGLRRISVTINGTTTAFTTTDVAGTDSTFIQGKNYLVVTANTDNSGNFNIAYRGIGADNEADINGIQLRPHVSGASINQLTLTNPALGVAYNAALTATGGTGTGKVWTISAGSLPTGLTLNSSTGAISGTPTAAGTFIFTVQMVDSGANTAIQAYSVTVGSILITRSTLPSGLVGTAYSQTMTSSGGSGGNVWSVSSGTLPTGLSLNSSTGAITGTPTVAGTSNLIFQVTDSSSATATQAITLVVQQNTTTSLTSNLASPSVLGGALSLTAAVVPSSTGTVIFYDGSVILGIKTLSSGTATLSYPLLPVGTHKLKVVYTGAALALPSQSAVRTQVVNSRAQSGFVGAVSSATGANPWSPAVGDFNNDGRPDLVVPNYGSTPGFVGGGTTVSIFLGTANPAAPFSAATTVSTVTGPINVAVGDFNEDGNADIAVAGYSSASVGILLGNGSGGFTASSFTAGVGTSPTAFALADFNGDGHIDMAVANNGSGNMGVLFGNGAGVFSPSATYTTGPNPAEVLTTDLNSDGFTDLILTNNNNQISVLLGQASGLFGAVTTYATGGTGTNSIALADFNGDGFLDIAASHSSSNNVGILLGTGSGTFGTATLVAGNGTTSSLKTGDFNGDGKADVAVTNYTNSNVYILPGNGNGTFGTGINYNAPSGAGSLYSVVADLNGDGVSDLVMANNTISTISTLIGIGTTTTTLTSSVNPTNFGQSTTLTATVSPSTATGSVTFLDGGSSIGTSTLSTGIATLSVSNLGFGPHTLTAVYAGDTTNATSTSSTVTQTVRQPVVVSTSTLPAGQNGSAYSQTLAATGGAGPYTWSVTTGALPTGVTLSTGGVLSGTPTVTGTFNFTVLATDSFSATGSQALSLLINPPPPPSTLTSLSIGGCSSGCTATLSQSVSLQATVTSAGNSVGSVGSVTFFSGTTILGVAPVTGGVATLATKTIPSGSNSLKAIYLANASYGLSASSATSLAVTPRAGTGFAAKSSYGSGGTNPYAVALGDVSGDGIPDLVVSNSGGSPGLIGVLVGNGSGGFTAAQTFAVGYITKGVVIGDFNSDGKADIAAVNNDDDTISILLNTSPNTSTLSFASAVNYAAGVLPQSMVVADFNGDGIADLAITNFVSPVTVRVWFGVGNGTFPASPSLILTGPAGNATGGLGVGDFDGNGTTDIAVGTGGTLSVFLNSGGGSFGAANNFSFGVMTNPVSFTIGDFNADGKTDVALANYQPSPSGTAVVLLNNTVASLSFTAAGTYQLGANPSSIASGDFNGDGNPDLAAANLVDGNVNILRGSAAGSYTAQSIVAVGSFPQGILAGDVNGDGIVDIVTADSGAGVSVLVGIGSTTTSLTSSVNPTNFGQSTTLTATVSPSTASGTVTFKDGGSNIGTVTMTGGVATLSVSNLLSGARSLTAVYGGDATNTTSTSNTVSQVVRAPVTISTLTVPSGRVGTAYSQTLAATGGTSSYTWAVSTGTLPGGVTLSSGGVLSGTPAAAGTFSFTVQATDGASVSATQALSLVVVAANSVFNGQQVQVTWMYPDQSTIYQAPLTATVGAGVEFPGYASGNDAFNIDFSDTSILISSNRTGSNFDPAQPFNGLVITNPGGLPPFVNATIASTNWTDITSATFDSSRVSFDATHIYLNFKGMLNQVGMSVTIQVNGLSLTPSTLPGSAVGFPYSTQLSTLGGTGTGRVFSLTSGTLPTGLTLNTSTGVISGVPTVAGTFTPTIQVVDSGSNTTSLTYSVVIRANGLISTRWHGQPNAVYTGPGQIGYSSDVWNLYDTGSGSGLLKDNAGQSTPAGITWSADGAVNSQLLDSNNFCYPSPTPFCSLLANYLYKTSGATGNVTFGGLPASSPWDIYIYTQIEGSTSPRQLSVTVNGTTSATTSPSDRNDSTLILNKNYLVVNTTTTAGGQISVDFHGTAGDLEGDINGIQLRPHLAPLTITQVSLLPLVQAHTYTVTLTATGGTTTGLTWQVSSGSLPPGLTLSSGGALTGNPSAAGNYSFTVTVTDDQGNQASQALTQLINPPLSITTSTLPTGVLGSPYSQTLAAAGGTGGYVWSISGGSLPGGLTLNSASGLISGTPIQTGNPTVFFRVTDSSSSFTSVGLTLTVNPGVSVTTSTLPSGAIGAPYSQTLAATGGLGGYTWSITSGTLQTGLTLNSATGQISGTPTAGGAATITFRATDSGSNFGAGTLTLTIASATSTVLTKSLTSPSLLGVNLTLTASVTPNTSTGKVTFYDGSSVVGIGTLSGGSATISAKQLKTGTHALLAYYQGSALGSPSLSTGIVQVVNSAPQSGFGTGTQMATGAGPWMSATADFNGDGKTDYVVANYGANTISVFLGNGNGTFSLPTTITLGTNPFSVTTGDFNGDGFVDIAAANLFSDSVSVLLGDGAGTFAAAVNYTAGVGSHPGQIIAGDFNRDGFVDLVTVNYNSNNISVLFGTGTGTFGTGVLYAVGSGPASVVAGDFNQDGFPDLAVANQNTNDVSVLLGQNGGTFGTATNYVSGGVTLQGISAADFNGDGRLDLAVAATDTGSVTILLGTGTGAFAAPNSGGAVNQAYFAAPGDFNGDGIPDLVVAGDSGGYAVVLTGNGTGTFAAPALYSSGGSGARFVTVAELNGDSVSDIIVSNYWSAQASILLGVGGTTTTLTSSVNPSTVGQTTALTATVSAPVSTGTVAFQDGGVTIGTATPNSGIAILNAQFATAGTHSLTAIYGGDATHAPSTSSAVSQTVSKGTSTISLSANPNPSTWGNNVTFTATVVPSTATGTVTFLLNGLTMGTGVASGGVATFSTTTLAAGSYSITATYPGDTNYLSSSSNTVTQTVNALTTTTGLTSSPNPSVVGGNVTLTATVIPSSATGSVNFKDGATIIGTGTLSSGSASLLYGGFTAANHSLTAVYAGDGNNATSTSAAITQVVNAALVITTSTLPDAIQGTPYSQTLTATGGTGAKTWALISGTLPAGLTLNGATGIISGTPTTPDGQVIQVQVTDAASNTQTANLVIIVNPALQLISGTLFNGTVAFPYSQSLFATGGTGTGYTYAVSTGTLPAGLALNASTGAISGSPTVAGTYNFTIRVTDSSAATATQTYSIAIDGYGVLNVQFQPVDSSLFFGPALIGNDIDLWNSFGGPAGNRPALYDDAGNITAAGVTYNVPGGSTVTNVTSGGGGFCTPVTAFCNLMKTYLAAPPGATGTINLTGFTPGSAWDIYVYTQGDTSGRSLSVTATGASPVNSSAASASDSTFTANKNYILIPAIANGSGNIDLTFTGGGGGEGDLNGLQLTPHVTPISITSGALPAGVSGVGYSQTLSVSGGTGLLYNWAVTTGTLPTGLALNASTGAITGIPTVAGSFPFTVTVDDALNYVATKNFTIVVGPALSITSVSPLPTGFLGVPYSQTLTASGGTGGYVWAIQSGLFQSGLILDSSGVISGTPTSLGTANVVVQVFDSSNAAASKTLQLTVSAALSVMTSTLAGGEIGVPYSQTLSATGGAPAYTWSIVSGTLQAGLTLNPSTGAITGTPTVGGTNNLVFRATDSASNTAVSTTVALTVAPAVTITTSTLPAGVVGITYSQQLASTGGTGPYTWAITSGGIPGLTLFSNGILSGPPQTAGTFTVNVRVTDGLNAQANQTLSVTINGALQITTSVLPGGTVGIPYSQQLVAGGGSGSGRVFSISAGTMPLGLVLNQATGVLSGNPVTAGAASFTVQVTDSTSATASTPYSFTLNPFGSVNVQFQGPSASFYQGPAVIGAANDNWNQVLTPTGTATLNESHGQQSGVTFDWTGDSLVNGQLQSGFCSVAGPYCPLMNGYLAKTAGQPSLFTFGGLNPGSNWDIYVYTQPSTTATRSISGFLNSQAFGPSSTSSHTDSSFLLNKNYVVLNTNANAQGQLLLSLSGATGDLEADINGIQIRPHQAPLVISQSTAPLGVQGVPYNLALSATGGTGTGQIWSIISGQMPAGFSIGQANGIVAGVASASGTSNFTVQVVDSGGNTGTQAYSLVINPPIAISTSSLPNGVPTVAYSQTLAATGGFGGYTWSIQSGTLPAGITLNSGSGLLSGTPSVPGSSTVIFKVLDSGSQFITKSLTIVVASNLTITTSTLPTGTQGVLYNQTIVATGGVGALTYNVQAGTLPAGLTLTTSGVLSGTPTAAGTSSFTVRVIDTATGVATAAYSLLINPPIVINTSVLPTATQGTAYTQTLSAVGGSGTITWSFAPTSTAAQAGFSLSSSGVLTGTPNTFGTLSVVVTVQDQASNVSTATIPLPIARQGAATRDFIISDSSSGKLFRMASDGSSLLQICGPPNCRTGSITADAQGNVYSYDGSGVYKITPGGTVTTILTRSGGVGGAAVDASGNVIFVDNSSDTVYRVSPTGVLTTVGPLPIQSPGGLQDTAIALDANGDYIVASDDSNAVKLYRFTPAGVSTTLATIPSSGVTGVAVTSTGTIVFTDYRNRRLVTFDPAGSPNNAAVTNLDIGDAVINGLAIDPANGHYLVPGRQTATVSRVTPSGAITLLRAGSPITGPRSIVAVPTLGGPTITTSSLPNGLAGQNYGSVQFTAANGSGNYTWAATGFPSGMAFSTAGVLSGGPTGPGTFSINVTVTDVLTSLTGSATLSLRVNSPVPPLFISGSSSQANVAVGGAVSATFSASGGAPPYTFIGNGLPQGVSVSSGGILSGAPTQPGNFSASVGVSDTSGRSASTSFTINVLGIVAPSLPNGTVGTPYAVSFAAIAGLPPYTFTGSGLPPGLGISGAGTLSGTPTAGGTFTVGITVTDSGGARISTGGTVTILVPGAPVSIPSGNLPDGTVNVQYTASLSAVGGKSPYTWSILSGGLPEGLSFGSNGAVTGIPSAPGIASFAVLVTDAAGGTASTAVGFSVKPAPVVITSKSALASGMVGVEYPGVQLAASGGVSPYKWSVSSGSLPAGMSLDAGGTISGIPSAAGDFTFGVTVADAAGTTGTSSFSITVRPISADLIISTGTAAFELTTGAVSIPSGQTIGVQSTSVVQQISYGVTVTPAVGWLAINNGTKTPDSISIALSSGALSLPAGQYATTVKITCSTGSCAGSAQSVAVSLSITSPPPKLKAVTDVLAFTTTSQSLGPISENIALQNAGGGSLGVASVSCGAPWCVAGVPPSTIPGGSTVNVPVTVTPASVSPGFYRTTVEITTSAGKASVPVTLFIAQNSSMTLSPSGGQFSMPQGGAPGNPSGSFLVSVNSTPSVIFTAAQLPGADWLKLNTTSISASSAQPGTISYSIDTNAVAALKTGAYYGQISVGGPGIVNAPQTYQVILNVTPPTDVARPDPQPAGLLFLTTVGGTNPPPQVVNVFTSSTKAVQFQASATSEGGWLTVTPTIGTTSQPAPAATNASVNIAGLKTGVYTGLISYAFAGNAVRSVNVTLVVAPVGGTAATLTSSAVTPSVNAPLLPRDTCSATTLAAVQTGIVTNFSAPAAWPTPLSIKLVDDCGGTVTGAQIVTTFSNGDPPLPLPMIDSKNGLYAGTWTPRKQSGSLTINAKISAKGYKDLTTQLVGAVTPNAAPLLTPHGTVHAFSPLVGAPLAPGNIVAVYGTNLAILTGVPNAVPLPTAVNGTQVLIGGIKAPLYFTSPGQVNAQIPYELEPNKQYQVIVSANGALSTPDAIQLATVVPGLAAYADGTVIAQHADGTLINAKSPAKAGETAIAYLSGLGATDNAPTSGGASPGDVLARPNAIPTLTIGGKDAKIAFVGLTPGLVGLYQMNFEVPAGVPAGNPTITVTQDGASSAPVLIPYIP